MSNDCNVKPEKDAQILRIPRRENIELFGKSMDVVLVSFCLTRLGTPNSLNVQQSILTAMDRWCEVAVCRPAQPWVGMANQHWWANPRFLRTNILQFRGKLCLDSNTQGLKWDTNNRKARRKIAMLCSTSSAEYNHLKLDSWKSPVVWPDNL